MPLPVCDETSAEAANANERLVLARGADPRLKSAGRAFVPVAHEACAQRSDEEAAVVKELYASLLESRYVDRAGEERR